MSRAGDLIMVDGMKDLRVAFQKATKEIEQAAMTEYKNVALEIVGEAQHNLRKNGSIATSDLIGSGRVQMVDETTLDAGFFSDDQGYAFYVEYGRRAGKMPPVHQLEQWMNKKKDSARSGGKQYSYTRADIRKIWGIIGARKKAQDESPYLVPATFLSYKIGKVGTKPHPFLTPAVQKYKGQITKALRRAVKTITG